MHLFQIAVNIYFRPVIFLPARRIEYIILESWPCPCCPMVKPLGRICSRAWRSQWPRIDSSLGPNTSAC